MAQQTDLTWEYEIQVRENEDGEWKTVHGHIVDADKAFVLENEYRNNLYNEAESLFHGISTPKQARSAADRADQLAQTDVRVARRFVGQYTEVTRWQVDDEQRAARTA